MNELKIFENPQFGEVRTTEINGEMWFVAADVCRVLEIVNNRDAVERLDEDEKGVALTDTLGGIQQLMTVNEPGLYSLVLRSRKPEAKAFKRWITHEVIPSIRKHGGYLTPNRAAELLMDPDFIIKLATELKSEREARLRLLDDGRLETFASDREPLSVKITPPQEENMTIKDTAKQLGIKQRVFVDWLRFNHYLYQSRNKRLMPYANYDRSMFVVGECYSPSSTVDGIQTLITPKGRETLRLILDGQKP